MSEKQKTIKKDVAFEGVGLHTGNKARVVLKPAPVDSGISFVRVDLPQKPVIKVDITSILIDKKIPRCTSVGQGGFVIHTTEHLMSVLCGLGIDNLMIEIDNNELPGLDGSGIDYLSAIKKTGVVEQEKDRYYFAIREPIWVERNGSSIYVVPAPDFKVSYTLDYPHPGVRAQYLSVDIAPDVYEKEIAPCRTFCLESEAEELRKVGLGKGANFNNTLVIGKDGVIDNVLRFDNEFARHKILDFVGDLYLLGMPIRGHVYAVKSGHTLNLELLKKIDEQRKKYETKNPSAVGYDFSNAKEMDIHDIMKVLPHRYPFLLVDRVVSIERGLRAVGIKNVTINDHFFQGHFPSKPIMPGVLMVEAMAQVGGLALSTDPQHCGKYAFFLSADHVKFRKVVIPGDQLVIAVDVIRNKTRTAQVRAQTKVHDQVVAEADMVFSFIDAEYLS